MDLSYFLAKYFGVYMIIAGLWMIVRRDHLRAVVQNMVDNPALVMFSGALAFLMGWLVVLIHPVWTMTGRERSPCSLVFFLWQKASLGCSSLTRSVHG